MTNWEKYREEIEKIAENEDKDFVCAVRSYSVGDCENIDCDTCQRHSIEWLTQEADENKCDNCPKSNYGTRIPFKEECGNCKPNGEVMGEAESEELTLKDKVEKVAEKRDLFPMLSAEEKAYNKGYADGVSQYILEHAEPQQSKARFIEDVDGMIHNLKYITSINKKHNTFYVLYEGWHTAKEEFTDEVIQQLGIEVV